MSDFEFDFEDSGFSEQIYEGELVVEGGDAYRDEDRADYMSGSYADRERTGGKAFERRDMYDMSPEGKMLIAVRKEIGDYNFSDVKSKRIEEAIKRYDTKLKLCNPELLVSATLFLDAYGNRGGLNKKNFQDFEKKRKKSIKTLDLIRYIRFLDGLGMEV
jgi:hypothetical protein